MDLFNLIRAPGAAQVKVGTRQRGAHEVPLLTATQGRTVDMDAPPAISESTETPSAATKSPTMDEGQENPDLETTAEAHQTDIEADIVLVGSSADTDPTLPDPPATKKRRRLVRGSEEENTSKLQKTGPSNVFEENPASEGLSLDMPDPDLQFNKPSPISFAHPQQQPDPKIAQ